MIAPKTRRSWFLIPVAVAMLFGALLGAASAQEEPDQYTGCLTNAGSIKDVTIGEEPLKPCKANQTQITWSETGPQGPQGPQGEPGISGEACWVVCPECNLEDARYPGGNLRYAYLREANLESSDLSDADLSYAYLHSADLYGGANLRSANLSYALAHYVGLAFADLTDADLSYADLWAADLVGADLIGADLSYANLEFLDMNFADLTDADLTGATGQPNAPEATFSNTICPNGVNSDDNGDTCYGAWLP